MAPGAWALITGASSGIGLSLAHKLAQRQMNLVLVARNQTRLEKLAAELKAELAVETEVLVADLSKSTQRKAVAQRLKVDAADSGAVNSGAADSGAASPSRPIDLLVNNAGIWNFTPFADMKQSDLQQMISVNLLALVELTHAAIPEMVKRSHGAVLNVSSIAGFLPLPFEATYGATKAFVTSFSQGLYGELKDSGVHVCAVAPGVTRTELHERSDGLEHVSDLPDLAWMSADEVAEISIRALDKRTPLCVPGGINKVMSAFLDVVPTPLARWTASKVNQRRRGG